MIALIYNSLCSDNYIAIDIFFDDLNYNVIKQEPAYSLQDLLGKYINEFHNVYIVCYVNLMSQNLIIIHCKTNN